MITRQKLGIFGSVATAFLMISISGNLAFAADCLTELTKAENRWNKLRQEKKMTSEFKREVTFQLTLAAELRHQGMSADCLLQIGKASKEMDLVESKR